MPLSVRQMFDERDRLQAVIEEAKSAKIKLEKLNQLIALYGDDELAAAEEKAISSGKSRNKYDVSSFFLNGTYVCPHAACERREFDSAQGITMHITRSHKGKAA